MAPAACSPGLLEFLFFQAHGERIPCQSDEKGLDPGSPSQGLSLSLSLSLRLSLSPPVSLFFLSRSRGSRGVLLSLSVPPCHCALNPVESFKSTRTGSSRRSSFRCCDSAVPSSICSTLYLSAPHTNQVLVSLPPPSPSSSRLLLIILPTCTVAILVGRSCCMSYH